MLKKIVLFSLVWLLNPCILNAQPTETPTFRLFLIGDAGEDNTTEATLRDLGKLLEKYPQSAVIFLGDNCYRKAGFGLLPVNVKGYDGSKITKARIMSQLNILKNYEGHVFFIPGNHDYWNYTNLKHGQRALLKEELFIESVLKNYKTIKNNENTFVPSRGHPGPEVREFNNGRTRVIIIDTYRLILEEGEKRKDTVLINKFYSNLKKALKEGIAKRQKMIVAGHHPIHAKGKHSLPLAAWQTLFRRIADANTNYPPYNRMATQLDSVLKEERRADIYYVAGHEHSLEYFNNDSLTYLVSGAGSKVDLVDYKETVKENEYFIWNEEGFFEIQFFGRYERVLMHHRKEHKSEMKVHCLTGCEE